MSEIKKLSNQDILYDLEQSNVRDDVFTQIKGILEYYEQLYKDNMSLVQQVIKLKEHQPQPDEELVKIVKKAFDGYNSDVPEPILAEIRKLLGEK